MLESSKKKTLVEPGSQRSYSYKKGQLQGLACCKPTFELCSQYSEAHMAAATKVKLIKGKNLEQGCQIGPQKESK